jgi:hypothetical protein
MELRKKLRLFSEKKLLTMKKRKPARSEGEHVLGANRAGAKTIFSG